MSVAPDIEKWQLRIEQAELMQICGKVTRVTGLVVESTSPGLSLGQMCTIHPGNGRKPALAEVVGFRDSKALLIPLGDIRGVAPGSVVQPCDRPLTMRVGPEMLGRVIDGTGQPIDGRGPLKLRDEYPVMGDPINPMERRRITEPLPLGIRAIDTCLTCGKGQRLGIFAGSGIGKSVLLGMIARNTEAEVNVIGLIGERGREVKDFLEKDLGEEGLRRSVVVAVTSDQPALLRLHGAFAVTAIAEYFRDMGHDVLLMMDSITRFAMSQREIGLAVGEPPTTKGYPPSVFMLLPKLFERAGTSPSGSITGIYTVFVEADDFNEPISDTARSTLDGHIMLSRRLAAQNHYPAIDVLESVSRLMIDVVPEDQVLLSHMIRDALATYRDAQDLINIGAYVKGSNPKIDYAQSKIQQINSFLKQKMGERAGFAESVTTMRDIFRDQLTESPAAPAVRGEQQ
ncbi:MAG: FliI/YscN family ATPase [Candidatus Abyssobacteria bacterium SURF_17]|uniref:FliI/YscN family ATPase n=1 Tax=Candidatus Abyssobacteria bacterium SURF_17 TaxID=2093361 RepID=A0A419F4G3_9BACT|nr:MAG: FliI/YscN family ATPase [Candidatus Abyssubacteria bacterium SURF_17]